MEMEMEMEEEMEMEYMVFEAHEFDPDYEFDAAMYFDFTCEESIAEAREAERWFDTALSYPPSPFAAKLVLREDSLLENACTSLKSEDEEHRATGMNDGYSDGMSLEVSAIEVLYRECERMCRGIFTSIRSDILHKVSNQQVELATGLTLYDQTSTDKSKLKVKPAVKPKFPRSSTLMKPTASQLAKQNRPRQAGNSRFQTLLGQKEKSLCNSSVIESHPAKRQKLEGGHLRKTGDAKQQADFIHKTSKKDCNVDKLSAHAKLRLTVPREPDLETAHRAERMRPKDSTNQTQTVVPARRFKARPLNRKILEAPLLPLQKKSAPKLPEFQELHLKTLERAMQHTSSVSSSSFQCNNCDMVNKHSLNGLHKISMMAVAENMKTESSRPINMDTPKHDGYSATHVFKARPLNKKIFSSKGDMGIFRNSKRETTVPMEFKFHTEKRNQHNPPIELFSKLSLTSELQPNNRSRLQLPRPSYISLKGSKENRLNLLQTEQKMVYLVSETNTLTFVGNQRIKYGTSEVGNQLSRRSLGIR